MGVNTHPDLPGRPPLHGNLKETMNQGSSKKYHEDTNLKRELNQGSSKKYPQKKEPKIGSIAGSR